MLDADEAATAGELFRVRVPARGSAKGGAGRSRGPAGGGGDRVGGRRSPAPRVRRAVTRARVGGGGGGRRPLPARPGGAVATGTRKARAAAAAPSPTWQGFPQQPKPVLCCVLGNGSCCEFRTRRSGILAPRKERLQRSGANRKVEMTPC